MNINTIKNILDLKEGEGYSVLDLGIDKGSRSLKIEGEQHFLSIYKDFIEDLADVHIRLINLYMDEIMSDLVNLNDNLLKVISVSVTADEKENLIIINTPYIKTYKEGADELIELVQKIQLSLNKKLNEILSDFIDKEDNIKEFDFLFVKDSYGNFKYHSCVKRPDDTKQYEIDIDELLSLDFENKLLNKVTEIGYVLSKIECDYIGFYFYTDMQEVLELKIKIFKSNKWITLNALN